LGPLLPDVVFVGGCVPGLLITDEGAADLRSTQDVDVIVALTSSPDYANFSERLRELGFAEDTSEHAPICRWIIDGMILDVMPTDETILGYSNRWYVAAMEHAQEMRLAADLSISVVTAPYFVATKLEAFNGRGRGDFAMSPDLEDLVAVIDGRPTISGEISAESHDLREFIAAQFTRLLHAPEFLDALPGHLLPDAASQARLPELIVRLNKLAGL
jgi:hypothetical protein